MTKDKWRNKQLADLGAKAEQMIKELEEIGQAEAASQGSRVYIDAINHCYAIIGIVRTRAEK